MFGWRRRNEGFEWQEYVRTTILVRRADRQRKVDDVRMAALAKVKETKDRGVAVTRSWYQTASARLKEMVIAAARSSWSTTCRLSTLIWDATVVASTALGERLPAMPGFSSGARRIGALLPDAGGRFRFDPRLVFGALGAVAFIVVSASMFKGGRSVNVARLVPSLSIGSTELTGRADAVTGDLLRVEGQLVRLTGIETPEPKQPCLKSNGRRWSCGTSARSALDKLVHGKIVVCTSSGEDDAGHTLATCRSDETDIAAELVRGGHVFSIEGLLSTYASAEEEARTAKLGIWQGEFVRPDAWRQRVWEEAKRIAPEGCPIKGYVRASDRTYAMPWSAGYNGGKIRAVNGDRWFCSEEEARAAGFKLSSRS